MFCENPNGQFACGKCRACKLSKVNKKMIVSVFAAHFYKKFGQFLTLTFNDEFLPDGLNHEIFASFMKRLRRLDGTPDVKFNMAGEYGETSGREHFHVLFFNHRYDMEDVQRAWSDVYTGRPFGFVYDGTLTPQSMKYVSGYINKKGFDPESGKKPPYGRSSCNIPDGLTDYEILKMCTTGQVHYNGRNFSVPENWRRRYREIWKPCERIRAEWRDKHIDKKEFTPEQVRAMMDQRDIKINLKRKKKRRII